MDKYENYSTSSSNFYSGLNTNEDEYQSKLLNTSASIVKDDEGYVFALTLFQDYDRYFWLYLSSSDKSLLSDISRGSYNDVNIQSVVIASMKVLGKTEITSAKNIFPIAIISYSGSALQFTISLTSMTSNFVETQQRDLAASSLYTLSTSYTFLPSRWLNKVSIKNRVMLIGAVADLSTCFILYSKDDYFNIAEFNNNYGTVTNNFTLEVENKVETKTTFGIVQYKECGMFKYESLNKMYLIIAKTNDNDNVFYVFIVIAKFSELSWNSISDETNYSFYNNIPSAIQNKVCANVWISSNLKFMFYSKANTDWKLGYGKGLGTVRGSSELLNYVNGWSGVTYYEDDNSTLEIRNAVQDLYVQDMIFNQNSDKIIVLCNNNIGSWGYQASLGGTLITFPNTQTNVILFFIYNGNKWLQIGANIIDPNGFINTYNSSVSSKGEDYRPDFNFYRDGYYWNVSYTFPSNKIGGTKSYYTTINW